MTNQEAIEILKIERDHMTPTLLTERIEAMNMAIKALEQEPCEDAVSRKAAIDAALSAFSRGLLASPDIRRLSSVQPEIVRCGQCKYAEVADTQDNQDGYTCQFHRGSIWFSGSYCSWGERRTDGKN